MSDTPALELKQLTKRFGDFVAVNRVDLAVPRNQVVALVGESGSGKTTTGLLALRLLAHDGGQILLDGEDISTLSQKQMKAYRRRLQVVFQDSYSSLDPMMTLGEIVAEPLGIHGVATAAERRDTARGWLEKVGLDGSYANRYPHELSGGQRQRVGICRALIQNPELLLVDEPTASLDPKTSRQIMRLIEELCAERKLSAIINIHDVMLAQMFAERIVGLQIGAIVYDGPPDGLTPEVLTKIYGEEDWSATIRKVDEESADANNVVPFEAPAPDRNRLAGLT